MSVLAWIVVVESLLILAIFLLRWRVRRRFLSRTFSMREFRPTPDANRYVVVMHTPGGQTLEQYHGYDPVKARQAFEKAPMEAGCRVEFYEWEQRRGLREA